MKEVLAWKLAFTLYIDKIGRRESNGSVSQTFFFIVITFRTVRQCNRNSVIERINAIKKRTVNHRMLPLLLDCLIAYIADRIWCYFFLEIRRYISHVAHTGLYTKAMFCV